MEKRNEIVGEWQENSKENPFWINYKKHESNTKVEVSFFNGETHVLKCTICSRFLFDRVEKWREISF